MEALNNEITILTIDDERALRHSIRAYLEDYDYNVIEAEDGQAGQETFLREKPDLVLVDLRMPKVDGLDVLKFVREHDPDTPVIVISGTGQIASVVDALHYGASDYILKPIQDMTVLLHAVEKALERKRLIIERRQHREQLEKEVAARTKEIREANKILNREVEERKKAENEIKRMWNYLGNVFDSISFVLIATDGSGKIRHWNKAAEIYMGIPAEKVLMKNIWKNVPLLKEFQPYFEKVQESGKTQEWEGKKKIQDKDRYLRVSMFPLAYEGNEGIVIQLEDITEQKKKDEQLRHAHKMETIGILAGGLAHDFNNVLGGIIGPLSLIQGEMENGEIANDILYRYLHDIDESAQRAADIVKQLLALSRKEELSFVPVDLNDVIRHVMKICKNTFDKSIELKPVYTEKPANVFADLAQIEQVLLNLCVNAYHAMTIMRAEGERWHGRLKITSRRFYADKTFCEAHREAEVGPYWKLSVEDEGVGMPPETIPQVFSPFFTTKDKNKGTGLGLSMVLNIIKQHKGFVNVFSEVGKGSTFNVFLPELFDKKASAEKRIFTTEKITGKGLIMVVEDEPIMRKVAISILKSSGYEVIVAGDGEEAIPLFKKHHKKIQMVLLDMLMPRKSGKETLQEMKKIDPDVKVLLNSGFRRDERVEAVMKLGVSGFIEKPYTKKELLRAVYNILKSMD